MLGRLSTLARIGAVAHLAALVCLAVAFAKRDALAVEGAYFNRSVGAPERDGVLAVTGGAVAPWLLATAILLVLGTAAFLRDARRRP